MVFCRLQLRDAWKSFRRSAVRLRFIPLSMSSCMLSSVILCSLDLGRRNVSPVVCDADEFQRKTRWGYEGNPQSAQFLADGIPQVLPVCDNMAACIAESYR